MYRKLRNQMTFTGRMAILTIVCLLFPAGVAYAPPPGPGNSSGGRKAVILIDPANKQNISGNVSFCHASGTRLTPPNSMGRALINLKEAMHRWTKIRVEIDQGISLSSPRIHRMPFIYVPFDKGFELTEAEKKNVRKYVLGGGFLFLENFRPEQGQMSSRANAVSDVFHEMLGSAKVASIPNNHELYHCYFDFGDGPPQGGDMGNVTIGTDFLDNNKPKLAQPRIRRSIDGITYQGRMVAVYSTKLYGLKWKEMANNEPQLRFGVNLVVFALTQPAGSERVKLDITDAPGAPVKTDVDIDIKLEMPK